MLRGVGAERLDRAGYVDCARVHGVAEPFGGASADDDAAGLKHEAGHVPNRATHDQRATLHRDARARAGVALDVDQAAPDGGGGTRTGMTVNLNVPAHHALGQAPAAVALDPD